MTKKKILDAVTGHTSFIEECIPLRDNEISLYNSFLEDSLTFSYSDRQLPGRARYCRLTR